jgi:hypothetical protein
MDVAKGLDNRSPTRVAIPAAQCDVWRNQGATATAVTTHQAVRNALSADSSPMRGRDHEVYLQGSYRNDTNIRSDSDVDVVVQLNETYYSDLAALEPMEKERYDSARTPATYSVDQFDADVLQALRTYFGSAAVTVKNKCITLAGGSGRLRADVVVAAEYRRYWRFRSTSEQSYTEGITFWGRTDRLQVVNYPRVHYNNGVTKNGQTRWYKPSVRMFKNARRYLVEQGTIPTNIAPSYFVEGWLYNVPDDCFVIGSEDTFYNVLVWLDKNPDWTKFLCQNEQQWLFGVAPVQWRIESAKRLRDELTVLWNDWNK